MQPLLYRHFRRSPWAAAWPAAEHSPEWPTRGRARAHMPEPEPDNVPLPPTPHQPPAPDMPPEIIEPPEPGHDVPVRDPGLWSRSAFSSFSPIGCPQP